MTSPKRGQTRDELAETGYSWGHQGIKGMGNRKQKMKPGRAGDRGKKIKKDDRDPWGYN